MAIFFGAFGLPALIAFLTRLLLGVDVVTVFGRRSKTNLRFALRKQRAREVYGTICAAVRNAQRAGGGSGRSRSRRIIAAHVNLSAGTKLGP